MDDFRGKTLIILIFTLPGIAAIYRVLTMGSGGEIMLCSVQLFKLTGFTSLRKLKLREVNSLLG